MANFPFQNLRHDVPIVDATTGLPTDYFLQMMRALTENGEENDLEKLSGDTLLNTGTGLSGGGALGTPLTLSLNAALNDLTDVDTATTPPVNKQALIWDQPTTKWIPGDVASGGGGGPIVFLSEQVAAASASLNFTSLITAAYSVYTFDLSELILSNNGAALYLQFSTNNGATWITVGTYITSAHQANQAAFSGNASFVSANGIALIQAYGTGAGKSLNGGFTLRGALNAALYTSVTIHAGSFKSDGNWYNTIATGWHESAVAVNAVRIIPSAGTITSGRVRMFGVGTAANGNTLLGEVIAAGTELSLSVAIPTGYKKLRFDLIGRGNQNNVSIRLNNDTSAIYDNVRAFWSNTGLSGFDGNAGQVRNSPTITANGGTAPAPIFMSGDILNPSDAQEKQVIWRGKQLINAAGSQYYQMHGTLGWRSTAIINTVAVICESTTGVAGLWTAGTVFRVYGDN